MADPLGFLASVLRGTYNGMSEAGEGLAKGALDAATLPRDVYQGKVQTDPRYMSEEEFGRTLNLAGNVAGGGVTLGSAPEGAIGMFAGQRAKGADLNAMGTARAYESVGKPVDGYKQTGWFRGVDDQMRFEIPDAAAKTRDLPGMDSFGFTAKASDYLDHPELFKAYPQLAEVPVLHQPGLQGAAYGHPHAAYPNGYIKLDMMGTPGAVETMQPRSLMLHEMQHAVQKIEGFANGVGGGSAAPEITASGTNRALQQKVNETPVGPDRDRAKSAYEWNKYRDYERSAGEVEARQVQERADWPLEKRMEMHPVQQQMTPSYPGDPTRRYTPDQQWLPGTELPYPVSDYNPNLPFMAKFLGK